ncbi:hypothetical protein [Dictyobacter kobayashii]|uniref:Uncharacterized protein n=1 Tax=Dictyobacter kobayashii TaxID=2014872 RepID=A0A402AIU7_9CHLR|nr:hypothetical protein [Dictyobacter kobayashii]GCE18993.1 hypothetical protein KDK_27930 [Dictyobacter kobayashii]
MITQTLKRWLNQLFAWWPWKGATTTNQVQPTSRVSWSPAPEATWYANAHEIESATPQVGNASIALEQDMDATHQDTRPAEHDQTADPPSQTQSTTISNNVFLNRPPILSTKKPVDTVTLSAQKNNHDSTDAESHLLFLHYLVQQGIFNEGFKEEQIPEQYRGK